MIELYFYEDTTRVYLFEADITLSRGPFGKKGHIKDAIDGSQRFCFGAVPSKDISKWGGTTRGTFEYSRCVRVSIMPPDAKESLTKLYDKLSTI